MSVHSSSIVAASARLGAGCRIWHFCHIMEDAVIGEGCVLGQNCFVGRGVKIGARVRIQNNVSVYEGVELEDEVFCGPSVVFTNVKNPRAAVPRRGEFRKILVRRGATLGANATLLPGVSVGCYAFVAAGAVVTDNVNDHALVVGVPAKPVGWVSRAGERLVFDFDGRATCPRLGDEYRLRGGEFSRTTD